MQNERFQSQSHVKWECKYHVIITPKYRKKILYGQINKRAGEILRSLAMQKQVEIIEGHICPEHIHMVLSIPPKYSLAMIVGFLKGKCAIRLHQEFGRHYKNYHGKSFWSRGYFVSTVGLDEAKIRNYVKNQEKRDKQQDGNQLDIKWV